MRSRSAIVALALVASMAVPLAGVDATLTARAVGAAAVPGPPRSVYSLPSFSGMAKVVWKAPTSDGGSAITGYLVTPYLGTVAKPVRTFNSALTTELVKGLLNGKSYRFKVAARNAVGIGAGSVLSGVQVVGVPGQPGVPSLSKADLPPGEVYVRFNQPRGNAAPITYYTLRFTSSNGGATRTVNGRFTDGPAIHVSDLTAGKTYTCTVTATNRFGTGLRSKASPAIIV